MVWCHRWKENGDRRACVLQSWVLLETACHLVIWPCCSQARLAWGIHTLWSYEKPPRDWLSVRLAPVLSRSSLPLPTSETWRLLWALCFCVECYQQGSVTWKEHSDCSLVLEGPRKWQFWRAIAVWPSKLHSSLGVLLFPQHTFSVEMDRLDS